MFGIFKKSDKTTSHNASSEGSQLTSTSLPEEVLRLLSMCAELNSQNLMINLLDASASAQMSSSMQSMSIGKRLGLYVLDDANDSNPYCYITGGVAAGMVVHFNHDPEPKIEFETLDAFEKFLRDLRAKNQELGEVDVPAPAHPNQIALAAVLSELARTEDEDTEFLLCLYFPLLRGEHTKLLHELAAHSSFFVREAIADAIGTGCLQNSEATIRLLASDPHPQVRSAALRASKKLGQPRRDA